jgi:hypothetical protein
VLNVAPRDTGRYINGWVGAGVDGGLRVAGRAVPLRPSRFAEKWEERLAGQLKFFREVLAHWQAIHAELTERWAREYAGKASRSRRAAELRRRLREAQGKVRRYERDMALAEQAAREFNAKDPQVVIFGRKRKNDRVSAPMTVRAKIYGGRAERIGSGWTGTGPIGLRLINLEPHAKIVENRKKLVGQAARLMQQMGVASTAKKVAEMLDRGKVLSGGN